MALIDRFLLVTGTMRSGTSLMGELLYPRGASCGPHPDLIFSNDYTQTLQHLLKALRAHDPAARAVSPTITPKLTPAAVAEWRAALGGVDPAALAQLDDRAAREIVASTMIEEIRRYSSAAPALVAGQKQTQVTTEIDVLAEVFADARSVVMIRDPRDVIASHLMRLRTHGYSVAFIESMVAVILNFYEFVANRQDDRRIKVVRYEDLTADVERTLRDVLAFAGLDPDRYDWSGLEGLRSNSSFGTGAGMAMVDGVGLAPSVGRWRRTLAPRQIELIEAVLRPHMQAHGYEPATEEGQFDRAELRAFPALCEKILTVDFPYQIEVGPLFRRVGTLCSE